MLVALALLLGGLKPAERLGESSRRRVRGLAGPGSRR
jgi:hypothetical protein